MSKVLDRPKTLAELSTPIVDEPAVKAAAAKLTDVSIRHAEAVAVSVRYQTVLRPDAKSVDPLDRVHAMVHQPEAERALLALEGELLAAQRADAAARAAARDARRAGFQALRREAAAAITAAIPAWLAPSKRMQEVEQAMHTVLGEPYEPLSFIDGGRVEMFQSKLKEYGLD